MARRRVRSGVNVELNAVAYGRKCPVLDAFAADAAGR